MLQLPDQGENWAVGALWLVQLCVCVFLWAPLASAGCVTRQAGMGGRGHLAG